MKRSRRWKTPALGIVGMLCMITIAVWFAARDSRQRAESIEWVERTHALISSLRAIDNALAEAESGVRGYSLTGDSEFLMQLEHATDSMLAEHTHALELAEADGRDPASLREVRAPLELRREIILAAAQTIKSGERSAPTLEGRMLSAEIRRRLDEMVVEEKLLLEQRRMKLDRQSDATNATMLVVGGVTLVLLLVAFGNLFREIALRRRAEDASVQRQREIEGLLQLTELLQACRSLDEAYAIVSKLFPKLFESVAGALYLSRASRDFAERCASWGQFPFAPTFTLESCWAIRRGQIHDSSKSGAIACAHHEDRPDNTLCVALTAHGEMLGTLQLVSADAFDADLRNRLVVAGEQVAMAIANLQLRDKLRNQSIRDPLTGLFNRRYLEETLQRELALATRARGTVGVVAIDVDHFKRLNDTYGHEAGDHALRAIAKSLASNTRKGDIVARTGGEEIVVVLPGASSEDVAAKAELLRGAIEKLDIVRGGKALNVTASFGTAVFPATADTAAELLEQADHALYEAKRSGRNRVVGAGAIQVPNAVAPTQARFAPAS